MTELSDEVVAACCLPGGACHEAGLSDAQHKLDAPVARVARALSDSAASSWDKHKVRDDWETLAQAAIAAYEAKGDIPVDEG